MVIEPTVFGSERRRFDHKAIGTHVHEVGFEPKRTDGQRILSLPPYTSRASIP